MPLRLTQVADGVHRLEDVYTNWYLIEQGGRLTVLDAGLPADWEPFVAALASLGHEPADMLSALLLEERSLLFTGDTLVTLDVARGPRGRQGPQVVRGPHTDDADLAVESLSVLAATGAATVLPGHGDPWTDGIAAAAEIARRPA